ncbi:MAG: glycerophosphodiester phosphodiesterase family protein [Verrucomicrobiota bacterium]
MDLIAHRGASHDAPENTLAALRLAWSQDADAVEVDAHLTSDGRLAVIHDPDTRRTARVERLVAEMTLGELQRLDAGSWKAPMFAGEPIPALDAALLLVPAGRRIFVELKSGPEAVPELVRCLIRSRLNPAQVVVIAFDFEVARAAKQQLARCEVCWLLERDSEAGRLEWKEIVRRARAARLDGLDLKAEWVDRESELVAQTHAAGFKLYVWTVDDAPLARRLAAAGVDGITTNRPAWLRAGLHEE